MQSKPGQGTTVCIELPRSEAGPEEAAEPESVAAAPRARSGETVLVVDDEGLLRTLIVRVLQEYGYETLEAGDGAEALRWLREGRRIDLLVTDVGLPGGMNGRQVADAARGELPDLQVLFITGYAESALLGNGTLDTGMHIMAKPFEIDALARRVKDLIEGE